MTEHNLPEPDDAPWLNLTLTDEEYDENMKIVPKYPEKETQEFKDAMWRADMSVDYQVKVVYDVNGKCKMELL